MSGLRDFRTAALLVIALAAVAAVGAMLVAREGEPIRPSVITFTFAPAAPGATSGAMGPGRVEDGSFRSSALGRTMGYTVYLPPGYDAEPGLRFPTVFLLHGGSGLRSEWIDYGVLDAADRLMRTRTIGRFIIVLPQGDQEYWVDHVVDASVGANGEKWGTYTATEVVPEIDRRYRTVARADARALGGLSMGGHAAMQLPLNFPGVWSVIGVHSPSLRPYGEAATYLGRGAEYAARDPLSLIKAKADLARGYTWWLDAGDVDPWRKQLEEIHGQLTSLGIEHEWHPYPGDHSLAYWSAHLEDYLRYYAAALCRRSRGC